MEAKYGPRICETGVPVAAGPSYSLLYPVVELLHGSDVESSVLSLLHNAQSVIEITQYCFGHRGIVEALARFLRHRSHLHGEVRMILDAQQMSNPSTTCNACASRVGSRRPSRDRRGQHDFHRYR